MIKVLQIKITAKKYSDSPSKILKIKNMKATAPWIHRQIL